MKNQQPEATCELIVDELGYVQTSSETRGFSEMEIVKEDDNKDTRKQPHEAVLTNLVCN